MRNSSSARDCTDVRACDRSRKSRRLVPAMFVIFGVIQCMFPLSSLSLNGCRLLICVGPLSNEIHHLLNLTFDDFEVG